MTTIVGRGIFGWSGIERRTDRYGAFSLADAGHDNNGLYSKAGWSADVRALVGEECKITVKVLKARESSHVGDLFRGIFPTTPEEGEVIDLGVGTLFFTEWDYAVGVGLIPDDGRETDWFDPEKLYRLHDQTVEVTVETVE